MKTSIVALSLASLVCSVIAANITVGPSGDYQTLGAALTALRAENADTPFASPARIDVAAGNYAETGLNLDFPVEVVCADDAVFNSTTAANVFTLSDSAAVLTNATVTSAKNIAILVSDGLAVGCTVRNCSTSSGPTVRVNGGTLRAAKIHSNSGGYVFNTSEIDNIYVLRIHSGLAEDCEIYSNSAFMTYVGVDGGTLRNSLIRENGNNDSDDNYAHNVMSIRSGLVDGCCIRGNGKSTASEGTGSYLNQHGCPSAPLSQISMFGGTLRNSLVFGNNHKTRPGVAVLNAAARVENCTIGAYGAKSNASTGMDLYMSAGTAVNCICWGSLLEADGGIYVGSGASLTYSAVPYNSGLAGAGILCGIDPLFVNAANGDYTLQANSFCRDAGTAVVGNEARQIGSALDLGAYELPPPAAGTVYCNTRILSTQYDQSGNATVTIASIAGAGNGAPLSYSWTENDTQIGTASTLAYSFAPGNHTVKLTVADGTGNAESTQEFFVYGTEVHIPAGTSLLDVSDMIAGGAGHIQKVYFAEGVYNLTSPLSFSLPVEILPEPGADVIFDFGDAVGILTLDGNGVVLRGFTLRHLRPRTNSQGQYDGHTVVFVQNGAKMIDCTVTDAWAGTFYLPLVKVTDAEIANCIFQNSTSYYAFDNPYLTLAANSIVRDTVFDNCNGHDSVVYQTGANSLMTNCVFRNCKTTSQSGPNLRCNMMKLDAGLATHIVITNCGSTSWSNNNDEGKGGIIGIGGGTLRNSLLADNYAKKNAGIHLTSGRVENCTVLGGTLSATADGTIRNLQQTSGTVVNSIFWNNSGIDGAKVTGGSFTYSTSIVQKTGEGNRAGDPGLDENFSPISTSIARDNGTNLAWMTEDATDLFGSNRVVNSTVDIGAVEGAELPRELLLSVDYVFDSTDGDDVSYLFTPTATIGYDPAENPQYTWTIDGISAGASTGAMVLSFEPGASTRTVGCKVQSGDLSKEVEMELIIHSGEFYVSADGSEEYPYSTWQTAARTPAVILALDHPVSDTRVYKMHVASGNYSAAAAVITSKLQIFGEDGAVFNSGSPFTIHNDDAGVSNIVFSAVKISQLGGTIRDCEMRNINISGGTAYVQQGGVLENFTFVNNSSLAWNYQYLYLISGGEARNIRFENCEGFEYLMDINGNSAVASNLVFTGCHRHVSSKSQGNLAQYVLKVEKGLVANCVITNNGESTSVRDGVAKVSGGTLRNALIAGNIATDCAGVNLCGGTLENVTVVVKDGECGHKTGKGTYGSTLHFSSGTAKNCVFWSNETADAGKYYIKKSGGTMANCWGNPQGADAAISCTDVITGAVPGFKTANGCEFVPAGNSPLVGKGQNLPWMTNAIDLRGEKRIKGKNVDIGAYEGDPKALTLMLR